MSSRQVKTIDPPDGRGSLAHLAPKTNQHPGTRLATLIMGPAGGEVEGLQKAGLSVPTC